MSAITTSRPKKALRPKLSKGKGDETLATQRADDTANRSPLPSPARLVKVEVTSPAWSEASSTPDSRNDVFDTPEHAPSQNSLRANSVDATPLTPPDAGPILADPLSPLLNKKGSRPVNTDPTADDVLKEEEDNIVKLEDYFTPQRITRTFTDKLRAVSESNERSAKEARFSSSPQFNFSEQQRVDAAITQAIKQEINSVPLAQLPLKSEKTEHSTAKLQKIKREYDLDLVIPSTLQKRLAEDAGKCVATLVKDGVSRCRYRAKGTKSSIQFTLEALTQACISREYSSIYECITQFAKSAMCGNHINRIRTPTKEIAIFKTHLDDVIQHGIPSDTKEYIDRWLDQLVDKNLAGDLVSDKTASELPLPTAKVNPPATVSIARPARVAAAVNYAPITSLLSFYPWQPRWMKAKPASNALRTIAQGELKETDLKRGYIYVFWFPGNFGYVKIGRSNDKERRLRETNRACKRIHEFHRPSWSEQLIEIPHVSRVERLIHAELKDQRHKLDCASCNKAHEEWFQTSEERFVQVFTKWKNWITTNPYEQNASGEWRLSDWALEILDEVCEPVTADVVAPKKQPHKKRAKGRRHKSFP